MYLKRGEKQRNLNMPDKNVSKKKRNLPNSYTISKMQETYPILHLAHKATPTRTMNESKVIFNL